MSTNPDKWKSYRVLIIIAIITLVGVLAIAMEGANYIKFDVITEQVVTIQPRGA